MRWGMVTNGFALTRQKCDELIDAGIYSITLSLDGTEKSHNYIRNNNLAFKRAKEALDLLGSSKVPTVDVVTCVYPKNIEELDEIASLLLDANIKLWRLFRIFPSGRARKNREILLSFDQTCKMVDWVEKNRPLLKNQGLSVSLSCEGYLPFHRDRKVRDQPFFCRAGINIASILCDGTVTGCPNNDPTFYEGNIIKEDFIRMWLRGFSRFRKREWIKETECARCHELKYCMGGSIHLWELGKKKPRFCYVKDVT
ncbi:MAG: SPASM domain-containing protein [Spirochaetales bacterium]|nr:SPASM domain-containing protein [Spirochaetales bacterium]